MSATNYYTINMSFRRGDGDMDVFTSRRFKTKSHAVRAMHKMRKYGFRRSLNETWTAKYNLVTYTRYGDVVECEDYSSVRHADMEIVGTSIPKHNINMTISAPEPPSSSTGVFSKYTLEEYGKGYLMRPPRGDANWGMKYFYVDGGCGWWNAKQNAWFFQSKYLQCLLDNGVQTKNKDLIYKKVSNWLPRDKFVAAQLRKPRKPCGFAMPCVISDELCDFMGKPKGTVIARTDVTKFITNYIKENELKVINSEIICNAPLKKLFKWNKTMEPVTYFNIQKFLRHHYNPIKASENKVDVVSNSTQTRRSKRLNGSKTLHEAKISSIEKRKRFERLNSLADELVKSRRSRRSIVSSAYDSEEDSDYVPPVEEEESEEYVPDADCDPDAEEDEDGELLFSNYTVRPYKRGFLLVPEEGDENWGEKYFHDGWWMPTQDAWFFRSKFYDFLVENGARALEDGPPSGLCDGMSVAEYGRGFLLTAPKNHPMYGQKYFYEDTKLGWWMKSKSSSQQGWFFRKWDEVIELLNEGAVML